MEITKDKLDLFATDLKSQAAEHLMNFHRMEGAQYAVQAILVELEKVEVPEEAAGGTETKT